MHTAIYIVGGKINDNSASDQTLLFNYTTNKFRTITNTTNATNVAFASMPKPLYGTMCHFVNNTNINGTKGSKHGMLYVIGGEGNKDILQYNISSNEWIIIGGNATLNQIRSFTRSIYFEDSTEDFIFVIGGGSPLTHSFSNATDILYQ